MHLGALSSMSAKVDVMYDTVQASKASSRGGTWEYTGLFKASHVRDYHQKLSRRNEQYSLQMEV